MRISDWSSDVCSSDLQNIQSLGGRVHIQSRPGQGSSFILTLPLTLAVLDGMVLRVGEQSRSEEHTSELQSLMRISYAVFCLKKKNNTTITISNHIIRHNTNS